MLWMSSEISDPDQAMAIAVLKWQQVAAFE